MITLYGVPFSAHTRKVILALRHKNLDFKLEPVVPLDPPEGWFELSPMGKIPVIKDGDFTLTDSSVICAYLDKQYPQQPLYPGDNQDYARALWFEEYVDGNLQQFVLHQFLLETIFGPAFLKTKTNWEVVNNALNLEIPKRFAQLNDWVRPNNFLVADQFSIADITLASILINFNYGGKRVDAKQYPKLAGYFAFILEQEPVKSVLAEEQPAAKTVPGLDVEFVQEVL